MAKMLDSAVLEKRLPELIWMNGEPWEFDEGTDYNCSQHSFIKHLRYEATKRGFKLRLVRRQTDSFVIVVHRRNGGASA